MVAHVNMVNKLIQNINLLGPSICWKKICYNLIIKTCINIYIQKSRIETNDVFVNVSDPPKELAYKQKIKNNSTHMNLEHKVAKYI